MQSRSTGRFGRAARAAGADSGQSFASKALADEPEVQVRILQNAPVASEVSPAGAVYTGQHISTKATFAYDLVEQGIAEPVSDEDEEALQGADSSKLEADHSVAEGRFDELMELDKNQLSGMGESAGVKEASKQGKDGLAVDLAKAEAAGAEVDGEQSMDEDKAEEKAGRSKASAESAEAEVQEDSEEGEEKMGRARGH
jgi:hypothetical protein